ncbi:hypothetical protein [Parvicella tangerina]|uniref:Uncharacterized protein n=1 Tax=Parvicella tangerina TaxID=2829795 RepID=A0A916JN38_9FLAO|nr:hypothetical protein [Parvicella tangerina]CAG5083207.1 hypothetical protein CRYO30217_02122 [Parvicella tangerina]
MVVRPREQFWIKQILLSTTLSALIFFSVSFLTYLRNIIPFHYLGKDEWYHVEIGFPITFYSEFFLDGNRSPNAGWDEHALLIDILATWLTTLLGYLLFLKYYKKTKYNLDKHDA